MFHLWWFSGSVKTGSYVYNPRSGKKERISRLFQMNSNKDIPMDSIEAGDIGAGLGFKDIRTGDTLCDEEKPIILESMTFPDTLISIAIEPKSQAEVDKLDKGLAKLLRRPNKPYNLIKASISNNFLNIIIVLFISWMRLS